MNIDKLNGFCTFVEAGACYETTAKKLNKSASGIYKSIKSLEGSIGHRLVDSLSGSPIVTDHGYIFYQYSKSILRLAESAINSLDDDFNKITGTLNISTTHAIAALWIIDDIAEFIKQYPEINVNIIGSDHSIEKTAHYDIAIRPKIDDPFNLLKQDLLTTQEMHLYASEEYVAKFGAPSSPNDLKLHRLIAYGERVDYPYNEINWHLYLTGSKIKAFFSVNSGPAILKSVENGIGIASISNVGMNISRVPLVRILPELCGPIIHWYFIVDKITAESKKVKIFHDYIKNKYEIKKDNI